MRVVIVGCGIVGAALAYHLSGLGLSVRVIEKQDEPGIASTGAALGILMAVSSLKREGDLTTLRLLSQQLYSTWLCQIAQETGMVVPNCQGLLCLPNPNDRLRWETLITIRQQQGYPLYWLTREELSAYNLPDVPLGIYSPTDRALQPQALVKVLVAAAQVRGATFEWGTSLDRQDIAKLDADRVVIASGLGTSQLVDTPLQAVGGQGIQVQVSGLPPHLPIVHAMAGPAEVNIVPWGNQEYWIGATVEFDPQELPRESNITLLLHLAKQCFPVFGEATVTKVWAGYRPRPIDRPAPVIGFLPGSEQVIVAAGHFRSGILLAPITAQIVGDLILRGDSDLPWRTFAPRRLVC